MADQASNPQRQPKYWRTSNMPLSDVVRTRIVKEDKLTDMLGNTQGRIGKVNKKNIEPEEN